MKPGPIFHKSELHLDSIYDLYICLFLRPPRFPFPRLELPNRSFLRPPVPSITSPISGSWSRRSCRCRNSSSLKQCTRFRAKAGSSTNKAFMPIVYAIRVLCVKSCVGCHPISKGNTKARKSLKLTYRRSTFCSTLES